MANKAVVIRLTRRDPSLGGGDLFLNGKSFPLGVDFETDMNTYHLIKDVKENVKTSYINYSPVQILDALQKKDPYTVYTMKDAEEALQGIRNGVTHPVLPAMTWEPQVNAEIIEILD